MTFCCASFESRVKYSGNVVFDRTYNNKYYIPTFKKVTTKLLGVIEQTFLVEEKEPLDYCPWCGKRIEYEKMQP